MISATLLNAHERDLFHLLTTAIVSYYEVPSYRCSSDEVQSAARDALTHSFPVTIQVGCADPLLKPKLNHNTDAGLNEYKFGRVVAMSSTSIATVVADKGDVHHPNISALQGDGCHLHRR